MSIWLYPRELYRVNLTCKIPFCIKFSRGCRTKFSAQLLELFYLLSCVILPVKQALVTICFCLNFDIPAAYSYRTA